MSGNDLNRLHLALFVYGEKYFELCASIVLPNLISLISELPDDIRLITELRVLTNPIGRAKLAAAPALEKIRALVPVKLADTMEDAGYELYGTYGPMILGQARLVHEASLEGAGIIFCPPDLVWSRGSFAAIVRLAGRGYRAVIGPSARGVEEELSPIFRERIAASGAGSLDVSAAELTTLMFDHWQQMNDDFIWNAPRSIAWKSYAYWRVSERQLLMKCWQGPALFLWPYREVEDYDGWIDHRLIKSCARSMGEIYVVPDAREVQTLDLTPRNRPTGIVRSQRKRWNLFRQLLNRKRHCRYNILYGCSSIRIYKTPIAEEVWRAAERQFDLETRPAMYAAIVARPVSGLFADVSRHSGLSAALLRLSMFVSYMRSVLGLGPSGIANRLRRRLQLRTRYRRLLEFARAANKRLRLGARKSKCH